MIPGGDREGPRATGRGPEGDRILFTSVKPRVWLHCRSCVCLEALVWSNIIPHSPRLTDSSVPECVPGFRMPRSGLSGSALDLGILAPGGVSAVCVTKRWKVDLLASESDTRTSYVVLE